MPDITASSPVGTAVSAGTAALAALYNTRGNRRVGGALPGAGDFAEDYETCTGSSRYNSGGNSAPPDRSTAKRKA